MNGVARLVPPPGPARDIMVVAITAGVAVGLLVLDPQIFGQLPGLPWWVVAGAQLAGVASLLAWRRAPLAVAAVNAVLSVPVATLAAAPAAYAALAYGRPAARSWAAVAVLLVVAARPWAPELAQNAQGGVTVELQPVLAPVLVAVALGLRQRRAQARQLREARSREQLAAQVRAQERDRLAAEMHDVITHRVSLMVLQAGALQVSTGDETVRAQADALRRCGREALAELRELLAVLRDEPAAGERRPAAEPAVLDITDLVAASQEVGVPVELVADPTPLTTSPAVARTAYRVVQEALTNVRKHAPGASVRLAVCHEHDQLRLTVRNSPPAGSRPPRLVGTGGGLAGLRQRVELVRGSLAAGPCSDGGFEVRAVLPVRGGP